MVNAVVDGRAARSEGIRIRGAGSSQARCRRNLRPEHGLGVVDAAGAHSRAPYAESTGRVQMRKIAAHFSYANVAATLALVFAMTGGAYAALAPAQGGAVHACYQKRGGALRVRN